MKNNTLTILDKGLLMVTCSILFSSFIFSQGIGVNETSEEPDPSAILDVSSSTKGFLPPRMTTEQRNAIENPSEGLVIYNLTLHCLEYWNGTSWFNWCNGESGAPDEPPVVACEEQVTFTYKGNQVTYGIVEGTDGKCWLDRNLGASQVATSSNDVDAYGDLFQWGRGDDGHQNRTSPITSTLSTTDQPGHGDFIIIDNIPPNDWRSPSNDNLWQEVNGVNNPCPSGFRLPTADEFNAERLSWSSNDAQGAFNAPLKLPLAGNRGFSSGTLFSVGTFGSYWCSTLTGSNLNFLSFSANGANISNNPSHRANGLSIRCIQD